MNDSNMIYAKFHMVGNIAVTGYFDSTSEAIQFLPLHNKNGHRIGLVAIPSIVYIEYLDAE